MNREDFPMLFNNIIYFDNGATTFKPKQVLKKISDYYTEYTANAHRGDYHISLKVDTEYELARNTVQEFINAKDRSEIVFTSGSTESLNYIATGFFGNYLEAGDEILITKAEHASNVLPWFRLAKQLDVLVNFIDLDDNHYVTVDNVLKAITPRTKVISLAQITNVIGDIRPIKEICKIAHERGIFVVVDAAQSAPHIKIDVQDLDCDFLAFSGHKLCGPTGVGVLYGKKELLENMEPVNLGGGMNESFDTVNDVYLKSLPTRLEAGTPNIEGVLGLGEAINYLNSIGMDKIHEYEMALRKYLIEKLIDIKHIDIINMEADSGIVAFNVDGVFSQDVAVYLDKYNICLRAGNHCAKILKDEVGVKNTCRISLYFYNNYEEIDRLVELLKDKDRIVREMI
ncbi:cysteine desulfurase [Coprobacillus sp. CAG:605]|nr:cysteine desulfurase [Coprobacillus sp. CAG:605]